MLTRQIKLADTVFCFRSQLDLDWGGNLALFQTDDPADFTLDIRSACPGEELLQADGYAKIQRHGNCFDIALPVDMSLMPTLWSVLNMLPLSELLLDRGTLVMHASYIVHGDEGILFSGPSGVGKSTQADLWRQYRDAQVINGDRVLVTPEKGGTMVASHYLSGTSGICTNVTTPLRAIVLLEQAGENAILPTSAWQTLRLAMGQIDYDVSNREQLIKVSGLVEKMFRNTIVCRYGCRIDENAVDTLEKHLYQA